MINVAIGNKTITFESVDSILAALRGRAGNLRLAATMAAARYPYPEDHVEEREEICNIIYSIGRETQDAGTRKACSDSLWALNMYLAVLLQSEPKREAVRILDEEQVRAAKLAYPYSEIEA